MSRETVLRALATALFALFFAATIVFAVLSHVNAPSAGGPILCRAIVHVDAVDTDSLSVLVTVIDTDADGFISSTLDIGDTGEAAFGHMLGRGSPGLPELRSNIDLGWIGEVGYDDEFPLSAYDWKPFDPPH
ncbi:hypothetical protein H6A18_09055 [Collinsella tanakaei]|uniref:hypothetical protein n=1 Tax=Collinsella tanakaei TaxID=626935 RepID=UPI00195D2688|nr:hypothetical protein [Collinsella tanakaei]MBM6756649.1 hypothetical protein [Collinsella tanakaei]